MRISLLLQREPFGEILEKTLSAFFTSRLEQPYAVTWVENSRAVKLSGNEQVWLCNPYLNAIYRPDAGPETLEPALREFSRSLVAWRRPLQKLYCRLAAGAVTAKRLSPIRVIFSPPLPRAAELLIVGGNHRIRLLDRNRGLSYVITKHGFDISRIRNEISFRRAHPELPIPALVETADDGTWYSEKYIAATPINRLSDPGRAKPLLARAVQAVKNLAADTAAEMPLNDYCQTLQLEIRGRIAGSHLLSEQQKKKLNSQCDSIIRLIDKENPDASTLTTAQTHGDFQSGNILIEDNRIWLIDWEYTKRRQSAYDGLVYAFSSRFPNGLSERMHGELSKESNSILADWPGLNWADLSKRKTVLALFLLEELDLYLAENDNKLFNTLSGGMLQFLDEFDPCIKQL